MSILGLSHVCTVVGLRAKDRKLRKGDLVCFGLRYSLILYSTRYLYLDFETMNEELKRERALASFDPNELSAFLYGGEDNCAALKNFGM